MFMTVTWICPHPPFMCLALWLSILYCACSELASKHAWLVQCADLKLVLPANCDPLVITPLPELIRVSNTDAVKSCFILWCWSQFLATSYFLVCFEIFALLNICEFMPGVISICFVIVIIMKCEDKVLSVQFQYPGGSSEQQIIRYCYAWLFDVLVSTSSLGLCLNWNHSI